MQPGGGAGDVVFQHVHQARVDGADLVGADLADGRLVRQRGSTQRLDSTRELRTLRLRRSSRQVSGGLEAVHHLPPRVRRVDPTHPSVPR